MRKSSGILLTAVIGIIFAAIPAPFFPQRSDSRARREQQHDVSVTLKLIQVYVTDDRGNPLTDLSKEDFTIYDNGERKEITEFEIHALLSVEDDEALPSAQAPSLMPRKFFLLLDFFQNDMAGINKAKQAALGFIQSLAGSGDEVAVFSYDMDNGMRLHEFLSSDYEKAMKTVQTLSSPPAWEMRQSRESTEDEKIWMRNRSFQFVSEMTELAKSLQYIPGYKNLILFSGGIRRKLLYDQEEEYGEEEEELGAVGLKKVRRGIFNLYEDMAKAVAAADCVVFSVNTYHSKAIMNDSPEERGDHSLQIVSQLSGGKYFPQVEYRENITQDIQKATGNYYVLGYYISENWEGRYHKLKVEVRRMDARVASQKGYYDPKPFPEFSDFEKKLHLTSLALNEKSYYDPVQSFSTLSLYSNMKGELQSILLAEIPRNELGEIIQGKVEIINFILGEGNEIIDSDRCEIDFSVFKEATVCLYSIRTLKPGNYVCRTVIRNLKTGRAAVGSTEAVSPEQLEYGLILEPPLLVAPREKAAFVRLSEEYIDNGVQDAASLRDYYPYLTNQRPPIVEYLDAGTKTIFAILRGRISGIDAPEIGLSIYLRGDIPESEILLNSAVLFSQEEGDNTDVLFIEIELPDLEAGLYSLEFEGEELMTGLVSRSSSKIQIR